MEIEIMRRFVLALMIGTFVMVCATPLLSYYSACKSAHIYNLQNNTSFTCGDFFWASAQINSQTQTVKLLDSNRSFDFSKDHAEVLYNH